MNGPPDPGRRRLTAWLWRLPVLLVVAGGAIGGYLGVRTHFFKRRPPDEPRFRDGPRVHVAPLSSFGGPWAATPFRYEDTPALAVRLPSPIPGGVSLDNGVHLAGFSRMCTHQRCVLSLNRDVEAIAFAFNHRADGPSLVCPCHLSVFDPARAGRAVAGPATAPLPRVRLAVDEGTVVATGMEPEPVG